MYRISLLVAGLLLVANPLRAQSTFGKPEDIKVVNSTPLIVGLQEPDPSVEKRLSKKPADLKSYHDFLDANNATVRQYVDQYWKASPSVEYKPESEITALTKDKTAKHAVLHFTDLKFQSHTLSGPTRIYTSETVPSLVLEVVGKGKKSTVTAMSMAAKTVYESDMIIAVRQAQQYMEKRAGGASDNDLLAQIRINGPRLKEKTLLLEKGVADEDLTPAEIKKAYPYPCEIVPRTVIEDAFRTADARYAFVKLAPGQFSMVGKMIIDTQTTDLMGYSIAGGLNIKKANLKDFAKFATGK